MRYIWTLAFVLVSTLLFCQGANEVQNDEAFLKLVTNLYEKGVDMKGDRFFINEEAQTLIESEQARKEMYPAEYTWQKTFEYIKNNELKKAFWYMINLAAISEANRSMVVKSMLTYDQVFRMDEVLVSTFYTYCYMDPQIGTIEDGKPIIKKPHILEDKLRSVQEIIHYMEKYKSEKY